MTVGQKSGLFGDGLLKVMDGFGNMFICESELVPEVVLTGKYKEAFEAFK